MPPYVPNNLYVFCTALAGASAGLLANSTSLSTSSTYDGYLNTLPIAMAYAEAIDTAWASELNPTVYEKDEIDDLSTLYWSQQNPIGKPAADDPASYTTLAKAFLAIVQAGDDALAAQNIVSPAIGGGGGSGYPNAIDIRTFGAISGRDSTVAIQTAVTLASSLISTSGAVYVPQGSFPFSATITGLNDCIIYGAGYGSILQPTFAGAPAFTLTGARVFFQTFAIIPTAACTDAIYLDNAQQTVLDGMFINGDEIGFTRGAVTLDGGDCYGTTITNCTEIFESVGDGLHAVAGFEQSGIWITNSHLHGALGWNVNVDSGAATATELHITDSIIEGGSLGEITGCFFGATITGCHIESSAIGAGGSQIKITGTQRYLGLVITGNFFENHRTGAPGNYCVELNPTGVDSNGLVMHGNFFDEFVTAGAFIGPLNNLYHIGPNFANGTAYAGTFGAGGYVFDTGGVFDRLSIIRTFALASQASYEVQGGGSNTIGATTTTFSYPITVAGFGLATDFTGIVHYEVSAIGRSTTTGDFFYAKLKANFSNVAGTLTLGSAGVTTVETDSLGGGVAGSAALTISGSDALLTVTGWAGVTVDWGFIYEARGRP
jgi:hypothetical protein